MDITGFVQSTDGKYAEVKVIRESACGGNCSSCGSGCSKEKSVTARNKADAKTGDRVVLRLDTKKVLWACFFVYTMPLILGIASSSAVFFYTQNEIWSIISFLAVLCIYITIMHFTDKKITDKYTMDIVCIL